MSITLFGLADEYVKVLQEIEMCDGELTPELEDKLKKAEDDILKKETGYIAIMDWFDQNIDLYKEYKRRCDGEINRIENRKTALQERLIEVMTMMNVNSFDTVLGKVNLQTSDKSVDINVSPDMLPKEYVTTEINYKVDKVGIKKALKEGKNIFGAELQDGKNFIRIFKKKVKNDESKKELQKKELES
jgi:hypothetical protein